MYYAFCITLLVSVAHSVSLGITQDNLIISILAQYNRGFAQGNPSVCYHRCSITVSETGRISQDTVL